MIAKGQMHNNRARQSPAEQSCSLYARRRYAKLCIAIRFYHSRCIVNVRS